MAVQTTFSETIREGVHGMVNRMVDHNVVSRSCETAAGIGFGLAVSQGTKDATAVIGGTATGFLGLTILDPTIIVPTSMAATPDTYPQNVEMGILTKGEMFITMPIAVTAGDPVTFSATTGALSNTGGVAVAGARWKYTRALGALGVVQLGIQR